MKNDFDLIKEKIDNSGITAPEQLSESAVRAMIEDRQPKPVELKPKRTRKAVAAIAASFVIVAAAGVILGTQLSKPPVVTEPVSSGPQLKTFDSYDDVKAAVEKANSSNDGWGWRLGRMSLEEDYAVSDAESSGSATGSSGSASGTGGSSAGSGASDSYSETYKQVAGVDEADIIKTDGKYIYCVDNYGYGSCVRIFTADGANSRLVTELDAEDHAPSTPDEAAKIRRDYYYYDSFTVSNMYLCDGRMVLLCVDNNSSETMTVAQVYDISDIGNIRLLDSFSQSGSHSASRMIGDTLYIVSTYYPYGDRIIPLCGSGSDPEQIPCDCVYSLEDPDNGSFLVVSAYNTKDYGALTESKAILGAVDDIYCNENNLYIYANRYDYRAQEWYGKLLYGSSGMTTQILKVNLTDGLSFTAFAEVDGYIDDRYALDEYEGYLRVATTSSQGDKDVNNLYVLDENLNTIGSVTGFARNESIKAVRYMGDTAYVITYEQTDPLFVIDLSDPAAPAILGEVKISGFSTMLVPIGDDLVLGLGYHTQEEDYIDMEVQEGFKLALFDVSDKANPKVLDSKSFVDCYSEVQYDPKALVYNPDRGDYVVPLNYAHYGWRDYTIVDDAEIDDGYTAPQDKDVYYGGMLNFKVENGGIKIIDRYQTEKTDSVQRCVYVGDTVYMTYADADGIALLTTPYQ